MGLEPNEETLTEEAQALIEWLETADERELRKQIRLVEKEYFRKDENE